MNYRLLDPGERELLQPLAAASPLVPLGPEYGTAAVAVAEDTRRRIQAALFLQLSWHMEPLIILPGFSSNGHRGLSRLNPLEMGKLLEQKVLAGYGSPGYYICGSTNSAINKMCQANQMQQLPGVSWVKIPRGG